MRDVSLTAADRKWLAVLLEDGERFVADDSQRRLIEAGLVRVSKKTGRAKLSFRGHAAALAASVRKANA